MGNPNIAAATSILGGTVYGTVANSLTEVLENAASSNSVLKVNSIVIINIDGTNAADVSATLSDASGGSDVTIENKAINLLASAASDLNYVISYETIS